MRSTKTESLELIKALSEAKAPSGFEDASPPSQWQGNLQRHLQQWKRIIFEIFM